MKVSQFKNALVGGGARANLFEVEMIYPAAAGGQSETRLGTFLIKAAQMPAASLGIIEANYRGRIFKIPGDRVFVEWNITVLNDTGYEIRNAFERWSNAINAFEANTGANNVNGLMTTATIYQLDRSGSRVKSYTLKDCWPSEVAPIEVSADSTNQIEEYTVTLQYCEWFSNTTS